LLYISLPGRKSLTRQTGDEIEADVVEAGVAEGRKSLERVGGVVRASEFCELGVVKRLGAEARAVDSEIAKRVELLARNAARIDLECDL
jgi:hypothetical protein